MSAEAIVTYLNIVLYAVSYQLQRPVEPYLVRSLIQNNNGGGGGGRGGPSSEGDAESSANATYGRLTSFFSFVQTIGSPLVGMLLDRAGPRRTSVAVYSASALSYWMLSVAATPAMLYWSKVPALLQHAFLVGQATVASLPDAGDEDGGDRGGGASSMRRAAALGRMTTAYTAGATLGPALGGYLASGSDLYAGARLAVWGSLASVLLSMAYLKDHRGGGNYDGDDGEGGGRRGDDEPGASPSSRIPRGGRDAPFVESASRSLRYLLHPTIGPLLFVKLLNGVSSSAFTTVLPLILANKLNFTTGQLGVFMSASSLTVAAFSAVGMAPAMACVGNVSDRLARAGIGCRIVSMVLFGIVGSQTMLAALPAAGPPTLEAGGDAAGGAPNVGLALTTLASVAASLSSHVHATALTTLTTGAVPPGERGAILGLEHGLFSLARIVGPPLGTTLLSWRGPSSLALGSIATAGAGGLWWVIDACVVMDVALMACLNVWSSRSSSIEKKNSDGTSGKVYLPLLEVGSDKDHSD
jgi:MFS family permease